MVLNYNNDDPFGRSEGRSWDTFLNAVPRYDLLVVMRTMNVAEAYEHGAQHVMRVFMSYDEHAHRPRALSAGEVQRWRSEVSFVGTWRRERGALLAYLLEDGVPLSLWGGRWERAPEWARLRTAWRGPNLVGDDYAKAIQCSKIAIGLLSKANRDEHTQRTLEIPSLGTVLCAERTSEHQGLFQEGREAIFWSDAAECSRACTELLQHDNRRREIAKLGCERVRASGTGNEPTLANILDFAFSLARR